LAPTLTPIDRTVAALFSGVIAFFETSTMSLAVPFLLQWTLMQCGVAGALFFLTRGKRSLVTVIAAATIASFSSLPGLMVWPVLIGAALLLRLEKRRVLI